MRGLLAALLFVGQIQIALAQTEPLAPPAVEVIQEDEPTGLGFAVAAGTVAVGAVVVDFVTGHALSGRIFGQTPRMVGRGVCKLLWTHAVGASKLLVGAP